MPDNDTSAPEPTEDRAKEAAPSPKRRRGCLRWLVLIGLILIGGAAFYVNFWLYHPMGEGPAGPPVAAAPFEETWSERPVVLLGFGDSVIAGYGATSGKGVYDRLVKNPDDEFTDMQGISLSAVLPNLSENNLALSGSTSLEHLEILIPKIPKYSDETFGIVVATIGGNDIIHMYGRTPPREGAMYGATLKQAQPWIRNLEERLNTILDEIAERFPGGYHVFLANIYDPTDGIGDTVNAGLPAWPEGLKVLNAYNDIIQQTCTQRDDATLVDMHSAFQGHGIHSRQFWRSFYDADDPGYWYWDNLEDPNDRGYDALRRLFLNQMAEVLPERLQELRSVKKN
ncbi:MAG: SGNH/GDSL hydrolase family protein [Planctomycetaceae bacterium]|nr:SGNH/GDSL hydrolase family protein [Planctomycetaceae bacterium]